MVRSNGGSWKKGLFCLVFLIFFISYWLMALSYVRAHGLPPGSEYNVMYTWDFFFFYWKAIVYLLHEWVNK